MNLRVCKKEGRPEERPINKKHIMKKMHLYEFTKNKLDPA